MSPYPASAMAAIPPSSRYTTRMNSPVRITPITAAFALASIAACPSVGPTVLCSMISTGTGRAPPRMSSVRSRASSGVNWPVIWVDPPTIPTSQATYGPTCGEEMISLSSTTATRLAGSPAGVQAALPVSCAQARSPEPRKSMVTDQPPTPCGSVWASAPATPSPVSPAGPRRSGWPPRRPAPAPRGGWSGLPCWAGRGWRPASSAGAAVARVLRRCGLVLAWAVAS